MPSMYYEDTRTSSYTMTKVYGWMFYAILLTALTAFGLPYALVALGRPDFYWPILSFGLVMVITLSIVGNFAIARAKSKWVPITIFSLFAISMGTWISPLILLYDLKTVVYSLLVTSGIFGIMATYGAVTKRDLSGFGTTLFMLLFGCLIMSLINIFVASSIANWIVSLLILAVYIGFIAFDVQRVKRVCQSGEANTNIALLMALNLYIDFIYIFVRMVSLIGNSRR